MRAFYLGYWDAACHAGERKKEMVNCRTGPPSSLYSHLSQAAVVLDSSQVLNEVPSPPVQRCDAFMGQ